MVPRIAAIIDVKVVNRKHVIIAQIPETSPDLTNARNATIMQLLEDVIDPATQLAYVEHRGTGITTMRRAVKEAGLLPPRFEDSISLFRVVFPRALAPALQYPSARRVREPSPQFVVQRMPNTVSLSSTVSRPSTVSRSSSARSDRRAAIRALLAERGPLMRTEIEAALALHQTTVSRWLRRMRDDGEIGLTTRREKDPNAHYELLPRKALKRR